MKKYLGLLAVLVLAFPARAYEFSDEVDRTDRLYHVMELRQSATAGFTFNKTWDLAVREELREVVYDSGSTPPAYFSKSYTTLEGGWKFFSYTDAFNNYKYNAKLNAGFTLRYLNQKLRDDAGNVQAPAKYLRYRPFVSLSGSVNFGTVKLTLRERFLADFRTDSVNTLEKPKCYMELRHRLHADFRIPGKTYKPFTYIEFANTLNQPSCYNPSGVRLYGGQYLSAIRTKVGLQWNINKEHALVFAYSFHFTQSREVNITRKSKEINRLYMEQTCKHIISLAYEFGY